MSMRLFLAGVILALSLAGACLAEIHWDYLMLTQQWAGTLCSFKECHTKPEDEDFTIHGLWPSIWPAEEPTECPVAPKFNESQLKPILRKLRRYWPDMFSDSDPDQF
ncbi:Self-incompatibility associated ribonuclease [Fasciola hepatica]|uniref:Self-incompatibility associated ribonuclease n=1 Tax=Fasciola hepatica TaxID=6192 RepID=A0A4E0S2B1_FASHE|nr:Self-incompatibility associated ribonuclease [Fasciola hepatica]